MSVAINCDLCGKPVHEVVYCISAYGVESLVSNNPSPMYTYDFHGKCINDWVREAFGKGVTVDAPGPSGMAKAFSSLTKASLGKEGKS